MLDHIEFQILDDYIDTRRHRKATTRSKWTFSVSAHMYVMIQNGKLHPFKFCDTIFLSLPANMCQSHQSLLIAHCAHERILM